MYLDYWELKEPPFENTPDPRFLYPSDQHREALRQLLHAIGEEKGCAVLTGEYGCGKTHLIRTIVDNLHESQYDVALVNYPIFQGEEFLEEILRQFGQDGKGAGRVDYFRELLRFFYQNVTNNKRNILIIDEAQIIDDTAVYEDLHALLEMQVEERFLLNVLLVGQPELAEHLKNHPQLDQRITVKFHLEGFDRQDTANYIRYRLSIAGCDKERFSDAALYLIHAISKGIARRINNLCGLCLLEGANQKVTIIDEEIIKLVF